MRGKRVIASIITVLFLLNLSSGIIVEATEISKNNTTASDAEAEIGKKISIKDITKSGSNEVLISWDKVKDAEYELMINDEITKVKENSIINKQDENKKYTYRVRYKLNDKYSLWCDEREYTIETNIVKSTTEIRGSTISTKNIVPYISGSVWGSKNATKNWYPLSNEGNGIYGVTLDSPIEKIKLNMQNSSGDLKIKYRAYIIENKSWTEWKNEGEEVGELNKTISAVSIQYASSSKAYIKYSTIDVENIQSPFYNNDEVYSNIENYKAIKGIKVGIENNYEVISANQTWTSGQVKEIKGYLEIPEGKTLTIQSGVKVNFKNELGSGNGFIVKGNLVINGTTAAPVIIDSSTNDLDIDIKPSGAITGDFVNITSQEGYENSLIEALGNITLRNYKLTNTSELINSKGILLNQDRFNNKKNTNILSNGEISKFNEGVNINVTQDGTEVTANKILNNNVGISVVNNDYTSNDLPLNIKSNTFTSNDTAINIKQTSLNKEKSYKSIVVDRNT
ncbi:MAG: hypothetical protein ACRC7N_14695, partial [Clostridium sp.]